MAKQKPKKRKDVKDCFQNKRKECCDIRNTSQKRGFSISIINPTTNQNNQEFGQTFNDFQ